MGLRETINQNPRVAGGITAGIVGLVVVILAIQLFSSKKGVGTRDAVTRVYFSDDDGKTWFPGSYYDQIPPFKSAAGKEAYRAHVLRLNGKNSVLYLEQYDEQAKKILDEFYSHPSNKTKLCPQRDELDGKQILVRKPGTKKWLHVVKDYKEAAAIRDYPPSAADGARLEEILPSDSE